MGNVRIEFAQTYFTLTKGLGQAEQAIAGLRQNAQTVQQSLGEQIDKVRSLDEQLTGRIEQGEVLLSKLSTLTRAHQVRSAAASDARLHAQPFRQSEIGLGKLNAQRRNRDESIEDGLLQDEVAA